MCKKKQMKCKNYLIIYIYFALFPLISSAPFKGLKGTAQISK